MLKNTLGLDFCYLNIIHILHSRYYSKIIGHVLKNKQKNKCVRIHEIIRLVVMKMKVKMKNVFHIHDMNQGTRKNRLRSRHGHKYSKCKKRVSMIMVNCIQQHRNTEAELKKRRCLEKNKAYTSTDALRP